MEGKKSKKDVVQGLIKSLASNEKKVRDTSVKVLQKWLQTKSEITELEMLKIWRALFYCMWHSDKPLIQQDLAIRLAKLIHSLPINKGLTFIKAFWTLIQREWHVIDKLRLDKYYTLLRKFMLESFNWLKEKGWEIQFVQEWMDILFTGPLSDKAPRGVGYHIVEVFFDELWQVEKSHMLAPAIMVVLLEPYYEKLANSQDSVLVTRIKENIFDKLLEDTESQVRTNNLRFDFAQPELEKS